MRSIFAAILLVSFSVTSLAHEYWLEPDKFFLTASERTPVRLFVGEGLKKEEERPFQSSKTPLLRVFSGEADFDLTGSAREGEAPLFSFSSDRRGNHLIALERNWSYITLEPEKLAEYLREDGMEYIIAERERLGESRKEGRERYSRFLKTLIQVGNKNDKTFSKRVGSKLEIILLENPYSKKVGDSLPVQVLFQAKPLKDKTIFADNRDADNVVIQTLKTDAQGKASVKLDRKGVWLVRLVFMQRCVKNCEGADWESFWGGFSFGVK